MKQILLLIMACVSMVLPSCQAVTGSGEVTVVWDNVESFRDGAIAVTAVAGAVISAGVTKAQEVTKQKATAGSNALETVKSNNETSTIINGQNTALETAKIPPPTQ